MRPLLILLTLAVLSAMILASPASPTTGKPADPNKQEKPSANPSKQADSKPASQPQGKGSPPNSLNKNSANQSPKQKPKAKVSNQAPPPPKGKDSADSKPAQKPAEKSTEKQAKRFVAFRSRM